MRSINKAIMIGNVGHAPEINTLEGNVLVAKLSLATTETYRTKRAITNRYRLASSCVLSICSVGHVA